MRKPVRVEGFRKWFEFWGCKYVVRNAGSGYYNWTVDFPTGTVLPETEPLNRTSSETSAADDAEKFIRAVLKRKPRIQSL